MPDIISLPLAFKQAGYATMCFGKVDARATEKKAWDNDTPVHRHPRYTRPENFKKGGKRKENATEISIDGDELALADGLIARDACNALASMPEDKPFFLAVGFRKPHLPFCAPEKYWKAYKREQFTNLNLPAPPQDMPKAAHYNSIELVGYRDIAKNIDALTEEQKVQLWHGYYASTSWADSQIGRVLNALKESPFAENTIIVMISDHGYHLGEQNIWCKATNFELATRVPMMVAMPGEKDDGQHSNALVELVDLYPTLADLCDLQAPENLEGLSVKPLLEYPDQPWKQAAFSEFQRPWMGSGKNEPAVMGHAIRTQTHRYVEWRLKKDNQLHATELYALNKFGDVETRNLAEDPEHTEACKVHAEILRQGWRHSLPISFQAKPADKP